MTCNHSRQDSTDNIYKMESERISNMDALLFALSLEVVLLQIRILEGSTELRAQCWNITTKLQKLQREKLARDRDTVKDVMSRTLIEVAENGEFPTLQKVVTILAQRASSPISKRLQYEQLLRSRDAIAEELEEKRQQWVIALRNADHKTAVTRDKINDDQMNANLRLAYAEKWVVARAESLELQCQKSRKPLPNVDHEDRIHAELLKAYELQIKEREESFRYWEQRYVTDIADMKTRLSARRAQLEVASLKHNELQKLFDLHEGEMRSWLTFKRERDARLAREERLRLSATRIQAWWRGTMVRRGLGAFRFMRNVKKSASKKKK